MQLFYRPIIVASFALSTTKLQMNAHADLIQRIQAYFDLFDGNKKSLKAAQPVIDNIIDPAFIVETPKGEIKYDQWLRGIEEELEGGTKATLTFIEPHSLGIEYEVAIDHHHEGSMRVRSIGVVSQKGMIVRVKPLEEAENYNKFLGTPDEQTSD